MRSIIGKSLMIGLATAVLPACSLIPDYQQPEPGVELADATASSETAAADLGWGEVFSGSSLAGSDSAGAR